VDVPLVVGAAIFGVGWAVTGYCPGPAVVAAGAGKPAAAVFLLAMFAGTKLSDWLAAVGSRIEPDRLVEPSTHQLGDQ
jgi:uncharacterized membrane protein YedE/YeeE